MDKFESDITKMMLQPDDEVKEAILCSIGISTIKVETGLYRGWFQGYSNNNYEHTNTLISNRLGGCKVKYYMFGGYKFWRVEK